MPTFTSVVTNVKNRQQKRKNGETPIINWIKGILQRL